MAKKTKKRGYLQDAQTGAAGLPSEVGGRPMPLRLRHLDNLKGRVLFCTPFPPETVKKEYKGVERTQYAYFAIVTKGQSFRRTEGSEDTDDVEMVKVSAPTAMTIYLSPTAAVEWRDMWKDYDPNGEDGLPMVIGEARKDRKTYETGMIFTIDPDTIVTDKGVDALLEECGGGESEFDIGDGDVPF